MNIILVGCGKVGAALAQQLSEEGHSIVVIDTNPDKIVGITQELDVLGITGNGSSIAVLSEAGMDGADVLIAVTGSDELNLLCCMFAKKAGHCHAIARVRNPLYSHELEFIKQQLGISTIINPELATAREISRLLRFPAASKIDTFAEGRVRLIKFDVQAGQGLDGLLVRDIPQRLGSDILICAVERGQEVLIPDGNFRLKNGDAVSFLATQDKATHFFGRLHLPTRPVRSTLIVGGGTIGFYLAKDLLAHDIAVRIVEQDPDRCQLLASELKGATVLHGDGTDRKFLQEAGLSLTESLVALTNMDEENVLLSLFAKKHSDAKLVAKVNRLDFDDILDGLDLGSVVYPKYMVCDFVVQYVRALQNAAGNNLKTLYRILDDRVEALEFNVQEESAATAATLAELKLKPNQLICCITRGEQVILPRGNDRIQVGDSVIVVTLERGLHDIRDIVRR